MHDQHFWSTNIPTHWMDGGKYVDCCYVKLIEYFLWFFPLVFFYPSRVNVPLRIGGAFWWLIYNAIESQRSTCFLCDQHLHLLTDNWVSVSVMWVYVTMFWDHATGTIIANYFSSILVKWVPQKNDPFRIFCNLQLLVTINYLNDCNFIDRMIDNLF